jgi:hypothetical protein
VQHFQHRYVAPPDQGTLVSQWSTDGRPIGYTLTEPNGQVKYFNAKGILDYVQETNGTRTNFNPVQDEEARDAVVTFRGATNDFTEPEISVADKAFATLHEQTGNTVLLKLSNGGGLTFVRLGQEWFSGDNDSNGLIRLTDHGLKEGGETWQLGNIWHEIGHNWDSNAENPEIVRKFEALSGWTQTNPDTKLTLGRRGLVYVGVPGAAAQRTFQFDREANGNQGGYVGVAGPGRTLPQGTLEAERDSNGNVWWYKLTELDGTVKYFNANGTLTSVLEANGNRNDFVDTNGNRIAYIQSRDGNWWYRADATFASDYARTNPKEDLAESFAAYFIQYERRNWSDYKSGGSLSVDNNNTVTVQIPVPGGGLSERVFTPDGQGGYYAHVGSEGTSTLVVQRSNGVPTQYTLTEPNGQVRTFTAQANGGLENVGPGQIPAKINLIGTMVEGLKQRSS